MHRPTNTWWGRNMVCLSADQFAEPPGEQWSRRETIEARGTKCNFDVEMDSGIPGPTLEPRRDEGMPTGAAPMEIPAVPPPALLPEENKLEIRDLSNSGGGDVAVKMQMMICGSSYADPTKTKVIDRVVRYTNILGILAERGLQIDRYWPDHYRKELTGTQKQLVTSVDRYITIVSTILVTAVTDLGFEYRFVHDGDRRGFTVKLAAKYVDECLDVVQLQHGKVVMTPLTEQKSLNLHD